MLYKNNKNKYNHAPNTTTQNVVLLTARVLDTVGAVSEFIDTMSCESDSRKISSCATVANARSEKQTRSFTRRGQKRFRSSRILFGTGECAGGHGEELTRHNLTHCFDILWCFVFCAVQGEDS